MNNLDSNDGLFQHYVACLERFTADFFDNLLTASYFSAVPMEATPGSVAELVNAYYGNRIYGVYDRLFDAIQSTKQGHSNVDTPMSIVGSQFHK